MKKIVFLSGLTPAITFAAFHISPYVGMYFGMLDANTKSVQTTNWAESDGVVKNYYDKKNLIGGVQAGLMTDINRWTVGSYFSYNYADINASSGTSATYNGAAYFENATVTMNYYYGFLGQLGYWLNDSSSVFLTAGAAYAKYNLKQEIKFTFSDKVFIGERSPTLWGLDLGLGFKYKIKPQLNVYILGQYIDFARYQVDNYRRGFDQNVLDRWVLYSELMMAKIGLEYRFNL